MQRVQNCGIPPGVEEQDIGALRVPCAWESEMKRHPAARASASINV